MTKIAAQEAPVEPHPALAALKQAMEEAIGLEEQAEQLEEDLKAIRSRLRHLQATQVPEMMMTIGLDTMVSGDWSVSLQEQVSGSLPKDQEARERAIEWLEDHDAADLIKTDVALKFGRSQHNEALALAAELAEKGFEPQVDHGVHSSTLHAYVRERLRDGQDIDLELLGCNVISIAKFKRRK